MHYGRHAFVWALADVSIGPSLFGHACPHFNNQPRQKGVYVSTKTFSGRVDTKKLEFAESVARRESGISFGQYCSTELLDYICATGTLPKFPSPAGDADPFSTMRLLSLIHA